MAEKPRVEATKAADPPSETEQRVGHRLELEFGSREEWDNPRLEGRRLFSELLGTFFLVLVAAGGGILVGQGQISLAAAVVAPGLMVMAIILFMGAVSGAHLNPAVSLAFALRGDFPWLRVPGYIVVQLVGATLACLFLDAVFGNIQHLEYHFTVTQGSPSSSHHATTLPARHVASRWSSSVRWTVTSSPIANRARGACPMCAAFHVADGTGTGLRGPVRNRDGRQTKDAIVRAARIRRAAARSRSPVQSTNQGAASSESAVGRSHRRSAGAGAAEQWRLRQPLPGPRHRPDLVGAAGRDARHRRLGSRHRHPGPGPWTGRGRRASDPAPAATARSSASSTLLGPNGHRAVQADVWRTDSGTWGAGVWSRSASTEPSPDAAR